MKKSAMQDLRQDLKRTIKTSNDALSGIDNKIVREACQDVVKQTLKAVIKRIDDKLLKVEKRQLINACNQKEFEDINGMGIHETITKGEQYYKEKFEKK